MEVSKIETFSDGVFAVAATLLIFQVQLPRFDTNMSNLALVASLKSLWPYYISLFTSFFTLVIMWVNHHYMLKKVHKISHPFFFANGSLLFLVILVPYTTAMVSQYLSTPAANAACAIYAGVFVFINIGYNFVWLTASYKRKLIASHVSNETVKKIWISNLAGLPVYLVAFGLAFASAYAALAICMIMWGYWVVMMRVD
jgi:uncharacterized membrane protein